MRGAGGDRLFGSQTRLGQTGASSFCLASVSGCSLTQCSLRIAVCFACQQPHGARDSVGAKRRRFASGARGEARAAGGEERRELRLLLPGRSAARRRGVTVPRAGETLLTRANLTGLPVHLTAKGGHKCHERSGNAWIQVEGYSQSDLGIWFNSDRPHPWFYSDEPGHWTVVLSTTSACPIVDSFRCTLETASVELLEHEQMSAEIGAGSSGLWCKFSFTIFCSQFETTKLVRFVTWAFPWTRPTQAAVAKCSTNT